MNYLELSSKEVERKTNKLYKKILADYKYELVIFVAKGSYTIGKILSNKNNCPLLEINATRKGNKIKKIISPLLKIIPKKMKIFLRKKELNSNIHGKNNDRKVTYNAMLWNKYKKVKKILLVDDSVDTGYSIKLCKKEIETFFKNSEVKVAALNYFTKSKKVVKIDFSIYQDTMLNGPWSNDSKEHIMFIEEYKEWTSKYK